MIGKSSRETLFLEHFILAWRKPTLKCKHRRETSLIWIIHLTWMPRILNWRAKKNSPLGNELWIKATSQKIIISQSKKKSKNFRLYKQVDTLEIKAKGVIFNFLKVQRDSTVKCRHLTTTLMISQCCMTKLILEAGRVAFSLSPFKILRFKR